MFCEKSLPFFFGGDALPLCHELRIPKRNRRVVLHGPQGIIVGKRDRHYRKIPFYTIVEFFPAGQVEMEGAVALFLDPVCFQKSADQLVVLFCRQVRFLVDVVVGGTDLYVVARPECKISLGPPGERRSGQEEKEGEHQCQTDQGHAFGRGRQPGDDLSEEEKVLAAVSVCGSFFFPEVKGAAGQIVEAADQIA